MIRKLSLVILKSIRGMYPYIACYFGGVLLLACAFQTSAATVVFLVFISGICFAWALDMVETRAFAAGSSEASAKLIAALTDGRDTNITVTFNKNAGDN